MKIKAILLLFILVTLGGSRSINAQGPASSTDAEAYAVYAVAIQDEWPIKVAKAQRLVIIRETSKDTGTRDLICLSPAAEANTKYGQIISAFQAANKTERKLERKFEISTPYELVSREAITRIFANQESGWKDYFAKYPDSGGVIGLSAVGFNADKTEALVYITHGCGGLCGGGRYHLLRKQNGVWSDDLSIRGVFCEWMSRS